MRISDPTSRKTPHPRAGDIPVRHSTVGSLLRSPVPLLAAVTAAGARSGPTSRRVGVAVVARSRSTRRRSSHYPVLFLIRHGLDLRLGAGLAKDHLDAAEWRPARRVVAQIHRFAASAASSCAQRLCFAPSSASSGRDLRPRPPGLRARSRTRRRRAAGRCGRKPRWSRRSRSRQPARHHVRERRAGGRGQRHFRPRGSGRRSGRRG